MAKHAEAGAVLSLQVAGKVADTNGPTLYVRAHQKERMQIVHPGLIDANYSNVLELSGPVKKHMSGLDKLDTVGKSVDSAGGLDAISKSADDIQTFLSSHEKMEGIMSTIDKFIGLGSQVASVSNRSCATLDAVVMISNVRLTTVSRFIPFSHWPGTEYKCFIR